METSTTGTARRPGGNPCLPEASGTAVGTTAGDRVSDLTQIDREINGARPLAEARLAPRTVQFSHPAIEESELCIEPERPNVETLLATRAEFTTWEDLVYLADQDEAACAEHWAYLRKVAREEIRSGHYASRRLDGNEGCPYSRALFLEIRAGLIEEWQPRGTTELLLIDSITQAHLARNRWIMAAACYEDPGDDLSETLYGVDPLSKTEREYSRLVESERPPRITTTAAVDRALGLAERWERTLLRCVRALRDLRRFSPTVVIRANGPVNVGGNQTNVQHTGDMISEG